MKAIFLICALMAVLAVCAAQEQPRITREMIMSILKNNRGNGNRMQGLSRNKRDADEAADEAIVDEDAVDEDNNDDDDDVSNENEADNEDDADADADSSDVEDADADSDDDSSADNEDDSDDADNNNDE